MAKEKLNAQLEANAPLSDNLGQKVEVSNNKKGKKGQKTDNKFVAFFKGIGRKFKEMFSELKKVTWPTWKVVLASLGTVLVVVLVFLLITIGFDSLCAWLLKLLTQS